MKKMIFILIFLCLIMPVYADIELTEEEEEWLNDHPVIVYAGDPLWPPIDFELNGSHSGLVVDYLDLIESYLDIRIEKVYMGTWENTIQSLMDRQVDMIAASYHEEREAYMNFSDIIIDVPYVIITRKDFEEDINYDNIAQYKVATVEGWALNDVLIKDHQGIELTTFDSVSNALKAVAFGNVDCMLQDMASVSYAIQEEKISNLKNAGDYPDNIDIRFVVRKDYDILIQLINKVLLDIPKQEKERILNKWITIDPKPFYRTTAFINLAAFSGVILLLTFLWIITLKRQIKIKTQALRDQLLKSEKMQIELKNKVQELFEIQQEVIHQERLAMLGSMVAGISHEVNNPLGVSLTTVTAFLESSEKINEDLSSNNLSKSKLEHYLKFSLETGRMMMNNIENAIRIIDNFRSIAVDQAKDDRITINVNDYLHTIVDNLKYELKKKHVAVKIICLDAIVMDLNAGAFTQIITNLIVNSLIHGFSDDTGNLITFKVMIFNKQLIIEYHDNGRGIAEENIPHIFEMFYTTRRQQGGSGLGLHIVKNLLEEKFDGRITFENEQGALFTIYIPI